MIIFTDERERIAALAAIDLAHKLISSSTIRDKLDTIDRWDYANKDVTLMDLENCFESIRYHAGRATMNDSTAPKERPPIPVDRDRTKPPS